MSSIASQSAQNDKGLRLSKTAGLCSILALTILCALSLGAFHIPISDIISANLSEQQEAVLYSIRLPRILLAVFVGAGLAVSGAALQGLFRNPLADPQLIGVSSGAALSVALMIVFIGAFNLPPYIMLFALSGAAFLGGLATCFIIFRIASISGKISVAHMLLAGIAISAIAFSGIGFLSYISDDQQLRAITFWTMGSLGGALWPSVIMCGAVVSASCLFIMKQSQALNILQLGEEESRYAGIDPERVKNFVILAIALCIGTCVAVSGIIGFVGLVVPHLIRLSFGADHRRLIPLSAVLGAILLLSADTIARIAVSPAEMPVGILTALIGGPYFLYLLMRQYKHGFSL